MGVQKQKSKGLYRVSILMIDRREVIRVIKKEIRNILYVVIGLFIPFIFVRNR